MTEFSTIEQLRRATGTPLNPSNWIAITQERINAFADCTEDQQWIHVDPLRAANGPFKGPIAHGYLTLSLLSKIFDEVIRIENITSAINYGLDRVRFPSPVPAGSNIRGQVTIASVSDIAHGVQVEFDVVIECDQTEKPACIARSIARYLA